MFKNKLKSLYTGPGLVAGKEYSVRSAIMHSEYDYVEAYSITDENNSDPGDDIYASDFFVRASCAEVNLEAETIRKTYEKSGFKGPYPYS